MTTTASFELDSSLIPEEWELATIGSFGEIISGNAFKSKQFVKAGVPVVKISNVQCGHYIKKNQEYLPESYMRDHKRFVVNQGDLLMALTRPITNNELKICRYPFSELGLLNQRVAKISTEGSVSENYIHLFFLSRDFKLQVQSKLTETLQPNLSPKDLARLYTAFPPLAEQKVIADKLDSLLAQVETTKARLDRVPDILKRFRQSVLAAAVSGRLTDKDGDFTSIHVEDTWSHDVEGRKHWKSFKFSEVVKVIGGSQPPKSEFRHEAAASYIRLIQIRDYKSDKHIVYIPLDKAKRFVSKDDVMIGRYGPPIFQILRGLEGAYNVALMKAEPNPDLIDKEYLYWYLQNYKLYSYIEAASDRTAGQSGVNKKHLESYPILLPPLDEQTEIVRRVEELFAFADAVEQKAQAATERVNKLTQSILAKAFCGELTADWRAANPDLISGENSAEALLEKIKAEREALKPKKKTRAKKVKKT